MPSAVQLPQLLPVAAFFCLGTAVRGRGTAAGKYPAPQGGPAHAGAAAERAAKGSWQRLAVRICGGSSAMMPDAHGPVAATATAICASRLVMATLAMAHLNIFSNCQLAFR